MKCPKCSCTKSGVIDSRYGEHKNTSHQYKRRRRVCKRCRTQFTTYEVMYMNNLTTNIIITRGGIKITTSKNLHDPVVLDIINLIKEAYEI